MRAAWMQARTAYGENYPCSCHVLRLGPAVGDQRQPVLTPAAAAYIRLRFLIDECLSARLGVLLSDAGHDAVHVGDLGLLGGTDETVMAAALDDRRIVVSADTDFGETLAASIAQYPSVLLLRRKGRTAALLPVPAFGPRLLLGTEGSTELVEANQHLVPNRLVTLNHSFRQPTLEGCLRHQLGRC